MQELFDHNGPMTEELAESNKKLAAMFGVGEKEENTMYDYPDPILRASSRQGGAHVDPPSIQKQRIAFNRRLANLNGRGSSGSANRKRQRVPARQ